MLCDVLKTLPSVRMDTRPRMADFAEVLAALDAVTDLGALERFLESRESLSVDVLESDPLGASILRLADTGFAGTATELWDRITEHPEHPPKGWPRDAKSLSNRLRRLAQDMLAVGVRIDFDRGTDRERTRLITLSRLPENIVRNVQNVRDGADGVLFGGSADDADDADDPFPDIEADDAGGHGHVLKALAERDAEGPRDEKVNLAPPGDKAVHDE